MKPHDAMVRGRLDSEAKAKAGVVLARMGLSMSAAIRLFLAFIAEAAQHLPEVVASVVALPGMDLEACRRRAAELGVPLRIREYMNVG